ncbi:hypothetical protein LCGC14_1243500 [marine sediment metagenome]|uniref:CMP/dCMP-type deaminase domain-containing protein n=1 Tax=marine sediment metagenome TaxID=412755 RepID=A0A0F9LSA5_9ZZZZ
MINRIVPGWREYFLSIVDVIATRSKDPHTQVGCVIVGPDHEIRSTGYNGFVRDAQDRIPERLNGPEKYFWIEHAERNAIYNAARMGTPLAGCHLYLRWFPCMDCARAIVQSGISEVTAGPPDLTNERWGEEFKRVLELFVEVGIPVWTGTE